jgi:hypothetical protein
MATEQDRLVKLYGEMSDEHVLDLFDDKDDLTDEARLVLTQELRRRGITAEPPPVQPIVETIEPEREQGFGPGVPGIVPGGAAAMEQALEPADATRDDGLARLISFYDGMQLSQACEILEDSDLEPSIEPIAGDALSGVPPRFEVWLDVGDIELAKALLRAKMGLFPLAEVDEDDAGETEDDAVTGLVGVFESESEAEEAKQILVAAGFDASVTRDMDGDPDDLTWTLIVDGAKQEEAIAALESGMGLG